MLLSRRKGILGLLAMLVLFSTHKHALSQNTASQELCYDVYFMPRFTKSICFFIPRTKFEKKSEKVKYADRSYFTTSLNDSVYELFYEPICLPNDIFLNMTSIQDAAPINDPRIILFGPNNEKIMINEKLWIYIDAAAYRIPENLWKLLYEKMPCDLAENWSNNFLTDGMDDTELRRKLLISEK